MWCSILFAVSGILISKILTLSLEYATGAFSLQSTVTQHAFLHKTEVWQVPSRNCCTTHALCWGWICDWSFVTVWMWGGRTCSICRCSCPEDSGKRVQGSLPFPINRWVKGEEGQRWCSFPLSPSLPLLPFAPCVCVCCCWLTADLCYWLTPVAGGLPSEGGGKALMNSCTSCPLRQPLHPFLN